MKNNVMRMMLVMESQFFCSKTNSRLASGALFKVGGGGRHSLIWLIQFRYVLLNTKKRLRSNDGILLSHPNFKTLTTLGNRAFVASAPKLWNDLPLEIRMAKSVYTFNKVLKTHLFL